MSTVFDDVWYVSPCTAPSNHEEKLRHVETSSKHLPGWVWLAPVASGLCGDLTRDCHSTGDASLG